MAVASLGTGFIAFVNDGQPDTQDPMLVSQDGEEWIETTANGLPGGMEARAAARVGNGVAVVVTRYHRLDVATSTDGIDWTTIHSEAFEATTGVAPDEGTVRIAEVDMADGPDGSAVVVGHVDMVDIEPSHLSFLYRVSTAGRP